MSRPLSPSIQASMDLPSDHRGPYVLIELSSQMLVKNLRHADTVEALIPHLSILIRATDRYGATPHRIIQETDLKAYLSAANTNYRAWWVGDDFVGPENYRDGSMLPYLHAM